MSKILHIDSSSRSATSVTRKLSKYMTEALQKSEPGHEVKYRDLISENPQYISEGAIAAMYTPDSARTPEQKLLV
ncbi:NAD(P)H-dependent oxidoreductase, partial [Acinetobacter baumannii]